MLFAVPLLVIMYAFLYVVMYLLHKPEVSRIKGSREFVRAEVQKLGPWTRGQKNALIAFLTAVGLWILPGFLALFSGASSPLSRRYGERVPEAVAALFAALLLFLLPLDWKKREFTLTWRQAVQIDWGTLLLFGGGLTLGDLMFQTKLADELGRGLLHFFGATSLWGLTLAGIYLAIIVTETTSNTAAATMVVPIMISIARRQPHTACYRRHYRCELRLHAPCFHSPQRHRLRVGPRSHHQDAQGRYNPQPHGRVVYLGESKNPAPPRRPGLEE
jgi:sodium-dependent dicarboxylate transporter 2/3/5